MSRGYKKMIGRSKWLTPAVLFVLVGAGLFMRLLTYQPPTTNSDAHGNWVAVIWMLHGTPYEIMLKTSRLGIHFPGLLTAKLFGEDAIVFSFTPLLAYLVVLLTSFFIVRKLAGYTPAIITAVCVLVFGAFAHSGTQMLPGIFIAAYFGLLTLSLVMYLPRRHWGWLLLAGTSFGFAYMSKITAVLVAPGVLLMFLRFRVRKEHIAIFAAGFLLVYAVEHAYYSSRGLPGGRLQELVKAKTVEKNAPQSHLDNSPASVREHFRERSNMITINGIHDSYKLIQRYLPEKAGWRWTMAFGYWLAASVYLLFFAAKRYHIPVFIMGSHVVFNTVALQRLFPPTLLTQPMKRYLDPYSGLIFVIAVLGTWHLARRLIYGKVIFRLPRPIISGLRYLAVSAALISLMFLFLIPILKMGHYRALRAINWGRQLVGIEFTKFAFYLTVLTVAAGLAWVGRHAIPEFLNYFRGRSRKQLWRQSAPLLIFGLSWLLLWPLIERNWGSMRWALPKAVAALQTGSHPIQKVKQDAELIDNTYEEGLLIISPRIHADGGLYHTARQCVRRAYVIYLSRQNLQSYEDLSIATTASFDPDPYVEINGVEYWVASKYQGAQLVNAAAALTPESQVLYIRPSVWMDARLVQVKELKSQPAE